MSPKDRTDAVADSLKIAKDYKQVAAGFLENSSGFSSMMNSHGLFAYSTDTNVAFNVTVRTEDGKGSGYASKGYNDFKQLDVKKATETAAKKAAGSSQRQGDRTWKIYGDPGADGRISVIGEPDVWTWMPGLPTKAEVF